MEWSWFKQCLTAWQTLSPEESRALDDFTESHSYQANARFAQACRSSQSGNSDAAWHLPDRTALFHALQSPHGVRGERGPQTEFESIPALSRQITAVLGRNVSPEPRARKKPLPVYARPLPASLPSGQDNNPSSATPVIFESSINSSAKRVPREQIAPVNLTERPSQEVNPAPERPPVMERFDRTLAEETEHPTPGKQPTNRIGFLEWLHKLAMAPTIKELPVSKDRPAIKEEVNELLPATTGTSLERYRAGKKKKKKKKTKQLVKASVRKNDDVATETLARLLALQGHDEEAIAMYERLKLLHPEKKATFAAQIEFIKSKRKDS